MKVDPFKALCIASNAFGVILLVLASVTINRDGDLTCGRREETTTCEKYELLIASASLGIIVSLMQIVGAAVLLLVWAGDKRKYAIIHIVCGVIALVAFILICILVADSLTSRLYESLLAFFVIDVLFCFISATVFCVCK